MPTLKHIARRIFDQTLTAIDIPATMRRKLVPDGSCITANDTIFNLADYSSVYAVAIGKASPAMARGLVAIIGSGALTDAILVAPRGLLPANKNDLLTTENSVAGFRSIAAGHPLPDEGSFTAAREILALLSKCDDRSLVFFLLSGGGSALVELPLDPSITLNGVQELYRLLVGCGASIDEINAVRKHLSAVKGGRLAAAAPAAMKLTLAVTDVPEGHESALASGPTLPDPTTVADTRAVIERYGLRDKLPAPLRAQLSADSALAETLKSGDPAFARNHFELLLGMRDLFHHAHFSSEANGCLTVCDNSTDDWPVAKAAGYLLDQLMSLAAASPGRRVALIADGELSSPVKGKGIGGRNSAFVLECVSRIAELKMEGKNIAVLSAGTDGIDGNSPAAGALADGNTLARAWSAGLDPADFAARSDSYTFFHRLGDAIETGPTGNNLRDLRVLIME
jgi:hydroxypyruvate reductase